LHGALLEAAGDSKAADRDAADASAAHEGVWEGIDPVVWGSYQYAVLQLGNPLLQPLQETT
jgi:hypothetical protein